MRDLLWRCDEHRGPDAVAEHLYVAEELAGRRPAPRRKRLSARLALRLRPRPQGAPVIGPGAS